MHRAAAKALFDRQAGFALDLLGERQWEILGSDFPFLDIVFLAKGRVPLRLQLGCWEWDELPPAITLKNRDGENLSTIPRDPGGVFNPSMHPTTGRPFICMRGSLEYHTHPSHVNDSWGQLRGKSSFNLGGIVTQVWRAWRNANP